MFSRSDAFIGKVQGELIGPCRIGVNVFRHSLLGVRVFCGFVCMLMSAQTSGLKEFDNRYEGITGRQDALEDLTILGLHHHVDPFTANSTLFVGFWVPRLPTQTHVLVEGVELRDDFHYRMQSKQFPIKSGGFNSFGPWPTAPFIDRFVTASNLGVRASYLSGDGLKVYLPVDVYQMWGASNDSSYSLYFAVGDNDIQTMDVSVATRTGRSVLSRVEKCDKRRNPDCIRYPAGSSQELVIDFTSLPMGEYTITLVGHLPRSSRLISLTATVYHRLVPASLK